MSNDFQKTVSNLRSQAQELLKTADVLEQQSAAQEAAIRQRVIDEVTAAVGQPTASVTKAKAKARADLNGATAVVTDKPKRVISAAYKKALATNLRKAREAKKEKAEKAAKANSARSIAQKKRWADKKKAAKKAGKKPAKKNKA